MMPEVGKKTRGTEITNTSIKEFHALVGGTYRANSSADPGSASTEIWVSNTAGSNVSGKWVSYNKDDHSTEQKLYWGDDADEATFLAWTGEGTNAISGSYATIPFTVADDVDDQTDLIVAYNAGKRTDFTGSKVPLHFRHALAQIRFKAQYDYVTPDDGVVGQEKIRINVCGVKICNLGNANTLTMPTTATTDGEKDIVNSDWGTVSGTKDYSIGYTTAKTLSSTAQYIDDNKPMLLIPQTVTAASPTGFTSIPVTGAYIGVYVNIVQEESTSTAVYPKDAAAATPGYAYAVIPVNPTWEAGKKYTYIMKFTNQSAGRIDPATTAAQIPDGKSAGDPIIKGVIPITFEVTVEDWDDTAGDTDINM